MAYRAAKDTVLILSRLQAAYPHPLTLEHEALHELLGPTNERITAEAARLLCDGDAPLLGVHCALKNISLSNLLLDRSERRLQFSERILCDT